MNIQNDGANNFYQNYIENQKAEQQKMMASAKTATNPEIRKYLETSAKVMGQFNQLDEFVFSQAQPQKPKGFFQKIKDAFKRIF